MTSIDAFDEDDVRSLGEKLASLELTDRERAALAALFAGDEVAGFGRFGLLGSIRAGFRRADGLGIRGFAGHRGVRARGVRGTSGDAGVRARKGPGPL